MKKAKVTERLQGDDMNEYKDEVCCGNCIHYVEQRDEEGFCAFSWPPYIEAKHQPVSAYNRCDLFEELPDNEKPMNWIDIVWTRKK